MPAEEAIQGDILLGLMQTSFFPFILNFPWTTHQRLYKIRLRNFTFDGRSHQTGDAAFTPATSKE
jgi:hypothetical protein